MVCCGYSFEFQQQGTHNLCLYKVDKKYTGCNLKTAILLDYMLLGVYAVIRSNMVFIVNKHSKCQLSLAY